jgi:gluconolactonase
VTPKTTDVPEVRELATGLLFPEGPVAMPDGSIVLVEIRRGTLSRVTPDGQVEVVAELGGGPNGAAIGPDGAAYICNNGGFAWTKVGDMVVPLDLETRSSQPPDFEGGWIERVDLATGESKVLYRDCDGNRFTSPNDIVFDADGGFWFTDLGKTRPREMDRGGLYYARPDGSSVEEIAFGLLGANGVGLSPGGDRVYVAESYTGRLWAWDLEAPGKVRDRGGTCLLATTGHFDSLAVEADGTVVIAAIGDGLCCYRPGGGHEYVPMPDPFTTNVCFGGGDLRTAYVTLSGAGQLVAADWPRPGLELAFS